MPLSAALSQLQMSISVCWNVPASIYTYYLLPPVAQCSHRTADAINASYRINIHSAVTAGHFRAMVRTQSHQNESRSCSDRTVTFRSNGIRIRLVSWIKAGIGVTSWLGFFLMGFVVTSLSFLRFLRRSTDHALHHNVKLTSTGASDVHAVKSWHLYLLRRRIWSLQDV